VPVRVEVYSDEETIEIFIEMVFETLPGRISVAILLPQAMLRAARGTPC
jgi:hypothetical protein